jgi:hypothetical protein
MFERPRVVVAHAWPSLRKSYAVLLPELRPGLVVHEVAPAAMERLLRALPAVIVVCDEPTAAVRAIALGWISLLPGGQNVARIGVGDTERTLLDPGIEDVAAAIDDLIAGTVLLPTASTEEHPSA